MGKKELVDEIEECVNHHDYENAIKKIDEMNIDVFNLKEKVKSLEICYSKIAVIGGLFQESFVEEREYNAIRERIIFKLTREQEEFFLYLNRVAR